MIPHLDVISIFIFSGSARHLLNIDVFCELVIPHEAASGQTARKVFSSRDLSAVPTMVEGYTRVEESVRFLDRQWTITCTASTEWTQDTRTILPVSLALAVSSVTLLLAVLLQYALPLHSISINT
jgi:hypothetical protein